MPIFTHDGLNFNYRETGAGTPFIFQHGLGGDVQQPFGLFQPPAGFRLLAFDCRGHGETQPLGDPNQFALAAFADDLRALLDHLQIHRAIIGGISMGAAVALNFALRYPDRVLGLVLSRPAWLDEPNPWNVEHFHLVAQLVREHGARQGQERFKETEAYRDALRQWPDVAASLALQFEHPRIESSVFKLERIINDHPNADRREWQSIRVPTLVLANRQDPIHPFEYGQILAGLIPGAEFQEITSKSISKDRHGLEVQQFIGEFLKKHFPAK
jgi:pimeloyl-ACP methyl ester carboxylesterase